MGEKRNKTAAVACRFVLILKVLFGWIKYYVHVIKRAFTEPIHPTAYDAVRQLLRWLDHLALHCTDRLKQLSAVSTFIQWPWPLVVHTV